MPGVRAGKSALQGRVFAVSARALRLWLTHGAGGGGERQGMIEYRTERAGDGEAIEALYLRAFGPGRFAKTAERLREGNAEIASLSRVALAEGKLVGAVRLWPVMAERGGELLFLGPIAVERAFRQHGIGARLTQMALAAAREAGWRAVCLVGDMGFFGPLGFAPLPAGQFGLPGPVDPRRLLMLELTPGCAQDYAGRLSVPRGARPAGEAPGSHPRQQDPAAEAGCARP